MENALILVAIVTVVGLGIALILRRGSQSSPPPSARPAPRPAATSQRRNWLVGESANVKDKAYHLGSRTVTIGRGVSNFVQITDPDASRVHCQFIPSPVGLQVKDMSSGNGTHVNEQRISVQVLKDGDLVRIGTTSFRYYAQGDFKDQALQTGKTVDRRAHRPTELGGVQTLADMLAKALEANNGDLDAAAKSLGMSADKLRGVMELQGLNPDDFKS